MSTSENLQLFEEQPIRTAWDSEAEEWYFSIVDVVAVLTEQATKKRQYVLGCTKEALENRRRGSVAYKL